MIHLPGTGVLRLKLKAAVKQGERILAGVLDKLEFQPKSLAFEEVEIKGDPIAVRPGQF